MAISNSIYPQLILQLELRRLFNAGLITPDYVDQNSLNQLNRQIKNTTTGKFRLYDKIAHDVFFDILGADELTEQYIKDWCIQWIGRMPYIFAYSFVYYLPPNAKQREEIQKYSKQIGIPEQQIIYPSSKTYDKYFNLAKYRMLSNYLVDPTSKQITPLNKLNFFDVYRPEFQNIGQQTRYNDSTQYSQTVVVEYDRPYTPTPVINKLTIKAKTQNNSIRIATLDITVYSLQDLDYIEKYFCSLGGRMLIQYGYTTTDGIKNVYEFKQSASYMDFANEKQIGGYLNQSNLRVKNKKSKGHSESFIGIVTNFSISVQQSGIYSISIQMYTQGICPIYARFSQIDIVQTYMTQQIVKTYKAGREPYLTKDKSGNVTGLQKNTPLKYKTLYDFLTSQDLIMLANLKDHMTINGQSHAITVMGQTYVTLYWIRQKILMNVFNKIVGRIEKNSGASSSTSAQILTYTKKLIYFDRFLSLPKNLISATPQSVIFPTDTQLTFLNVNRGNICKFNFTNLRQCIDDMASIEESLITETKTQKQAQSFIDGYLNEILNRQIADTAPANEYSFCNIGNTFINIKQIRDHVSRWGQNTKVDDLLKFIYDLLNSACGGIYMFSSYYNDEMDILIMTQINKLQNTNNLYVYQIPSVGKYSVLKQLNLSIKLPDAMKTAAYIGSNVSADQSYKRMSMMWDSYNDLKSDYMAGMPLARTTGFTSIQSLQQQEQSTTYTTNSEPTFEETEKKFNQLINPQKGKKYEWQKVTELTAKVPTFTLKDQDSKTIITYFKNQFQRVKQQTIGIQTRLFPVSLDVSLDLLTNAQWGMVFSIDNLPQRYRFIQSPQRGKSIGTYWGVVQIEHSIDNVSATTKLRGEMFNIK